MLQALYIASIVLYFILWLLLVAYLSLTLLYRAMYRKNAVPFLPADTLGIREVLKVAQLQGHENVIDIGSGWGSIVFAVAKAYPKIKMIGIELHPVLYLLSQVWRIIRYPNHSIKFMCGDAAKFTYESYDVVFLFMLSTFVDNVLAPKLEKELKPGAKVVSYVFKMTSTEFTEELITIKNGNWRNKIYVYTKK